MKLEYITLGLAALLLATSCRNKEKSEDTSEAMPVEVSLVAVDSVTLYKDYPGKLIADRTARAVAKVNGILSAPLYDGGEYVKEGQLLFTIDNSEYTNALNSALANLSKAKSDNAYAEQHYEAVNKAYSKNAVSQMELSQALNARDQSRAAIIQVPRLPWPTLAKGERLLGKGSAVGTRHHQSALKGKLCDG